MKAADDRCFFCQASNLRLAYRNGYHKRKPDYGPFDLYQCEACGSAVTLPPPAADMLSDFYRTTTEFGMSKSTRKILAKNPEAAWHDMSARRIVALSGKKREDAFTWIDIGAGAGEMALMLANQFPVATGIALDIHERPPTLEGTAIQWHRVDLSDLEWPARLGVHGDIVYATGVWEHVERADLFARAALSLMAPHGLLYMTTPNYSSLARRVFGSRWPYYAPGEHIAMPTPKGARLCLANELRNMHGTQAKARISAKPILVQYSAGFVLTKLGIPWIAKRMPNRPRVYLPSGAMEAVVRLI